MLISECRSWHLKIPKLLYWFRIPANIQWHVWHCRIIDTINLKCLRMGVLGSVSNGSGWPGFGLGWNQPEGPGPHQEQPSNLTRSVLAGLSPGPVINPRFFGRVEPGLRFYITVTASLAPIKYLSYHRIKTWWICRLCSSTSSFTSCFQICDLTDIRWVAVK
jgi:hypothetical protein